LRIFFRHDKRLHGEISRLVYGLVRDFTTAAAGRGVRTAAVVVFQSSGQFARWNPHWHGLFLEGGFNREGRFVHVPTVDLVKMSSCFRQRVIAFFLERKKLHERLAKNMLEWTHSGFSLDASIRILASSAKTREALAQYIVHPPVSLQNLLVEEGGTHTVVYRAPYSDYFRTDTKIFPPSSSWSRSSSTCPTRAADSYAPTGCTPLGLAASGHAALTSSASLPRAGNATIHPNHPSASARPRSRSPSCRCRPSRAAPHGHA
jgi:hypothetical protein